MAPKTLCFVLLVLFVSKVKSAEITPHRQIWLRHFDNACRRQSVFSVNARLFRATAFCFRGKLVELIGLKTNA
jgi:hypothetical protein